MIEMTWRDKRDALKALAGPLVLLVNDETGLVYASANLMCCDGSFQRGTGQTAVTLSEAIEELWREVTELPEGDHLYVGSYKNQGRRVRWNGFMWEDVSLDMNGRVV